MITTKSDNSFFPLFSSSNDIKDFIKYLENKSEEVQSLEKEYPDCYIWITINTNQYGNISSVSANFCPKQPKVGDLNGYGSVGLPEFEGENLKKEYKTFQQLRRKQKLIKISEQSR